MGQISKYFSVIDVQRIDEKDKFFKELADKATCVSSSHLKIKLELTLF